MACPGAELSHTWVCLASQYLLCLCFVEPLLGFLLHLASLSFQILQRHSPCFSPLLLPARAGVPTAPSQKTSLVLSEGGDPADNTSLPCILTEDMFLWGF